MYTYIYIYTHTYIYTYTYSEHDSSAAPAPEGVLGCGPRGESGPGACYAIAYCTILYHILYYNIV